MITILKVLVLSTVLLASSLGSGLAHSWYPPACCSDTDCKPVPCEELVENDNGGVTYKGTNFPKSMIHPSQDMQCHVCAGTYHQLDGGTQPIPRCIFILQGS